VLHNLRLPEQTVHPVQTTLANGIKLVVIPSAISRTVTLRGNILGNTGIQDPAGREGIDDIVEGLFSYGTTTYDRLTYQTELDKIAATVSAGKSFSLDVTSDAFERGVTLLADDELHPSFPADAFAIVKTQNVGALTGAIASPDYKAQLALVDALYPPGDPVRRHETPGSLGAVTLDDVKSYYGATYRPDLTTIVVIGDVTAERARAVVEAAFGGWHATGLRPDLFPAAVAPNKPSSHVVPATGRIQADVTLAQTLPIGYRAADFPLLQLANTVLTGGFYASLLFHDLRETHGYVYSVGSNMTGAHNRGTFSVNFGSDPQNVDRATRLVVDDLTTLQKKPIDAERLLTAKALVVGQLQVSQESYGGLAAQILDFVATGRPFDEDRIDAGTQLAASGEAVRAALARWIRPHDFVRVIEGPAR